MLVQLLYPLQIPLEFTRTKFFHKRMYVPLHQICNLRAAFITTKSNNSIYKFNLNERISS